MNAKIRLFIRVVQRRMENENKTADEILAEYPALTAEEVNEIKTNLGTPV